MHDSSFPKSRLRPSETWWHVEAHAVACGGVESSGSADGLDRLVGQLRKSLSDLKSVCMCVRETQREHVRQCVYVFV